MIRATPGDRFVHDVTNRGVSAWIVSAVLFAFYIVLYFTEWLTPLAQALHLGSKWTLYGTLYTLAITIGGWFMIRRYGHNRYQVIRALSVMNFIALLVHQYEEYEDPGYFPGQFNSGIFKSDQPRNYPLNTNTAMCINTAVAYPFYIAPIVFPKVKLLGLPPVLFGTVSLSAMV